MSRALVFEGDTIVIRDPATQTDRTYRVTGSGGGPRTLEPVRLPTVPGLYMTSNNIPTMAGVLIRLHGDGSWTILGGYGRQTAVEQRRQIEKWNDTLGLTKVKLVTA